MVINKNISYNKQHFIIFDFETSGLTHADEIIEYAFLEYKNNILVNSITALINPGFLINDKITQITGITNRELVGKDSIEKHKDKIFEFINGKVLIAHNVNFDLRFLKKLYEKDDLTITAVDSLSLIKNTINLPKYSLDYLREYYNIKHNNHRAYDDCLIVKEILDKLKI